MTVQILLDETPFGVRGAALDDETPTRLHHIFHHDPSPRTGDLYMARVGRRDQRLGAVVCDLGPAGEGLLTVKDKAYTDGQLIPVAIRREGFGGKRPLLTDRPLLKLPAATHALDPEADARPGPLGALEAPQEVLSPLASLPQAPGRLDSVPALIRLLTGIASSAATEIVCSTGEMAASLTDYVPETVELSGSDEVPMILNEIEDDALARVVPLDGGGSLVIDQAEALTAVDLDLGASSGLSKKGADAGLLRRALAVLGPSLSLHGLGGQVVLDLPRGATRAPKMIRDQLTASLKPFGLMSVPAVTKEGLVVMIFGQDRMPVLERLTEEVASSVVMAGRRLRPAVLAQRAYAALHDALRRDAGASLALHLRQDAEDLWRSTQASEPLVRAFTERFTILPSDHVDCQIETKP
ncbi:MAG: ribonuclease E/G [Pseudomonadota bacterium]